MWGEAGRPSMATVLFTDRVASTEARVSLGDVAANQLARVHDRLVARAVQTHYGRVVGSHGDGIIACFSSASDALDAAVAAQQALDRFNRTSGCPARLEVRMGLSAGDVSFLENGDCSGLPVVEASRLCAAAGGGQVLTSGIVPTLAWARAAHDFVELGTRELKGLPLPVSVLEVAWQPRGSTAVPLPAALLHVGSLPFVGRAREVECLTGAWKAAEDGSRVAFVSGEPGIGKSRLVAEVAEVVHGLGGAVLYGRCHEDLGLPYPPFAEALRTYVADCPPEELADQLGSLGGDLVRLVPRLGERVAGLGAPFRGESDTERYRLFEAVVGLLGKAGAAVPAMLVLDDLHWADRSTVALLRYLTHPGGSGLLVVGTYRDTDVAPGHPLCALLADLRRESDVEMVADGNGHGERISLCGLGLGEVEALLEATIGGDLDQEGRVLAEALSAETEGNPFFVVEMLRHLVGSGTLLPEDGGWTWGADVDRLGLPETVRELITRRLRRLPDHVVKTLEAASVIGKEFDLGLLRAVVGSGATDEDVFEGLDQATHAALVEQVGGREVRFGFSHVLVRQTLYEGLGGPRRERLHGRVAEAIEQTGAGDLAALAHHWLQAAPGRAEALEYSLRAGEQALAGLAYEEAAVHYERALQALDAQGSENPLTEVNVLLALADAWRRAADSRYREVAERAASLARSLGVGEAMARAALCSSRPGSWYTSIGEVDEALVALYDESIVALGEVDTPLRARALAQLGVELYWTPFWDRRVRLSDQAVAIARRLDEPITLAQVLVARVISLWGPPTLDERLALTSELTELAGRMDNPEVAFLSRFVRALALFESAELPEASEALEVAVQLAEQVHQPFYTWLLASVETMRAVMTGLAGAEALMGETLALGQQSNQPDAAHVFSAHLAQLCWDQGRFGELEGPIAFHVERTPKIPAWRGALALLYAETGQLQKARMEFEILAENGFPLPPDWVWMGGVSLVSDVCALLGDAVRAKMLYPMLAPFGNRLVVVGNGLVCMGAASRPLGLLAATAGDWDRAEGHFQHALALNARAGARAFLVRTYRAYAAMLLDRREVGDEGRAAELVLAGLELAEQLRMPVEATRLRELGTRVTQG